MIDIYKTSALKKIKGLEPKPHLKPEVRSHNKPAMHVSIHKTEQNFVVPNESDIYLSSLNKLKLKEYSFELFDIWVFVRNLGVAFVILLAVRYLSMIILGYFMSNSPLFLKVYFGFLPVLGYNANSDISQQINVFSTLTTAIVPILILIFWSLKGQSLTTAPRAYELVYKEINFLEYGSGIYKDASRTISKFVPKFFYEFVLAWYIIGFFGLLQYMALSFFSENKSTMNFGTDIWKFVFLALLSTWIVLVWNKKIKAIAAQWKTMTEAD
jgi:hypothetical protein